MYVGPVVENLRRRLEQIVDVLVQETTEEIVEVWRLTLQERTRQRTVEKIIDVLAPHIVSRPAAAAVQVSFLGSFC